MSEKNQAVGFVKYVLQQICHNSNEIVIDSKDDERGTLLTVKVAEEDMGKVIGKNGQTVSALRTLLSVISARENKRYFLKVLDSQEK